MDRREFVLSAVGVAAMAGLPTAVRALTKDQALWKYDAIGLAELVRTGQISPLELLNATIARCEHIDEKVNALSIKHYEKARADIAAGLPDGPLKGVPFILKDLEVELAGTVTTNGSKLMQKKADQDSELVARYRKAGLVMFAKAAAPEGGTAGSTESMMHGLTLNPWNPEVAAGGSSGGSCVAVASGMVPAAEASDGGGSIRAPASQCGIYGLKVSRGLTPYGGDLSVAHAVTKTVRDSAALLDAVAGPYHRSMYRAPMPEDDTYLELLDREPKKLKMAFFDSYEGYETHEECKIATRNAVRLCESLGHHVEEVKPPVDMAGLYQPFTTLFKVGMLRLVQFLEHIHGRPIQPGDVDAGKWIAAEEGKKIDGATYMAAHSKFAELTAKMGDFFTNYDVLVTPTLGQPPVHPSKLSPLTGPIDGVSKVTQVYGTTTVLGSLSGIPGASVPLHWTPEGLPVGVLFQSAIGQDARLLQLSAQLEKAQPWINKYPDLG
ncbi:amidase [Kordiimonas pumila]|uniref:Amidase n=1 Tax=Kordiimonas pumila TaxID=2161677 RepID=A0ABV7D4R8_9PROT|nr:amidase [Kordiimonas pumila]